MKKIVVIAAVILTLVITGGIAMPALAADRPGSSLRLENRSDRSGLAVLLERILLAREETRVDALLATAVENGKITSDQSSRIKARWTLLHERATKREGLRGLLRIRDKDQLQELLDEAVGVGRLSAEQAERIILAWERLHNQQATRDRAGSSSKQRPG